MRKFSKIEINIEDPSHLRTLLHLRMHPLVLGAAAFLLLAVAVMITLILIWATPLGRKLPGRLPDAQRAETQRQIMRTDSLIDVINRHRLWEENVLRVTDVSRLDGDSAIYSHTLSDYDPDSLPDATPVEARYVSALEEREKFNISVLAPLDADAMDFSPLTPSALFSSASKNLTTGTVLLPDASPIQAVADGYVAAAFLNPASSRFSVVVQHGRGFISSIANLGSPLVAPGDIVTAGQPIALAPAPDARGRRFLTIRISHNATPLIPYRVLPTLE